MRRIPLVYLSLDVGALLMGVMACSGDDDGGAVQGTSIRRSKTRKLSWRLTLSFQLTFRTRQIRQLTS
jgi:hypothetical protein